MPQDQEICISENDRHWPIKYPSQWQKRRPSNKVESFRWRAKMKKIVAKKKARILFDTRSGTDPDHSHENKNSQNKIFIV